MSVSSDHLDTKVIPLQNLLMFIQRSYMCVQSLFDRKLTILFLRVLLKMTGNNSVHGGARKRHKLELLMINKIKIKMWITTQN